MIDVQVVMVIDFGHDVVVADVDESLSIGQTFEMTVVSVMDYHVLSVVAVVH